MAREDPPLLRRRSPPLLASEPPRAGGKNPRAVPASRHRCDRAAPGTSACRESGEPPGALRLTFPTSAPRRIAPAARCGIGPRQRDPPGYV
jgi:hypothetical protein